MRQSEYWTVLKSPTAIHFNLVSGKFLEQGWRSYIPSQNMTRIVSSPAGDIVSIWKIRKWLSTVHMAISTTISQSPTGMDQKLCLQCSPIFSNPKFQTTFLQNHHSQVFHSNTDFLVPTPVATYKRKCLIVFTVSEGYRVHDGRARSGRKNSWEVKSWLICR